MQDKKAYTPPRIEKYGTVVDLTQNGNTTPIVRDIKGGSNNNQNANPN